MRLKMKLDTTGVTKMQRAMAQDQIPFATKVALNDVAGQAQRDQHNHIGRAFKVRRPGFTLRSVKHKPQATKQQLWTELKIEPPGGAARADILSKFEEGGVKRPTQGNHLTIPTGARKQSPSGVVPRNLTRKGLNFKPHGTGKSGWTVMRGDKRTFMIQRPDGSGGIFQRVGKGAARSSVKTGRLLAGVRPLHTFARSVTIDSRLQFEKNASTTVAAQWPAAFGRSFERAMKTAR
jgi:hypothetical protein